jgi:hypothetical protein
MTQQDLRLRSEVAPSNERSARVRDSRARVNAERAALAATLRERLTADLVIDGSAGQAWLIESAVSAMLEISVTNALFIRGYARPEAMARLGVARGAVQRALKALGALPADTVGDDGPPANATPEQKRAWSKQYVERVFAEDKAAE